MKERKLNTTELNFLCNKYKDYPNKNYSFVLKYCKNKHQKEFFLYFLEFNEHANFDWRSGIVKSKRWKQLMKLKFNKIISIYREAMKKGDFELVSLIKDGKFKL